MKYTYCLSIILCLAATGSCGTPKASASAGFPYGTPWELDFISGTRIAFEGLFPDRKPVLTFDAGASTASGNSGCNGYSAPVEVSGSSIQFGEPGPSTLMYCGPGENQFREMLQKVDRWEVNPDGKLTLLLGDVPMLRFKKATQ